MKWYVFPVLVGAGFLAGFVNTLAGSGSLITLPALIFAGLPANVANGTNRVAVVLQNIVGVSEFRRSGMLDARGAVLLAIPSVAGAIIGANIAVGLDEVMMRRVIGGVMVAMLAVLLLRPRRWLQGKVKHIEEFPGWKALMVFFVIGIYGGFIQAGVGIFLLAGLVLGMGYDLVRANAVKLTIVLLFTIVALVIFVSNGQVNWMAGLVLAVGNMLGAWAGTRVAVEKGAPWVHRLLIAVVAVSAAKLLGLFDLLAGL